MIIGEYRSKTNNKKRVAIPKKIREGFTEDIILTRGYEGSLVLVDKGMWERLASDVINGSFINQDIRDTTRFLIGGAVEAQPDSQGRIVIPDPLFEYAQLQSDVVFVGLINWVEIWSLARWEERVEYFTKNSDKIAQKLLDSSNGKK